MASVESNRTLQESPDFARRERTLTSADTLRLVPPAPVAGTPTPDETVIDLCRSCGAPIGTPYTAALPMPLRSSLPRGPNGGVVLARRVPATEEWITAEYFPPDDDYDEFWPVEPLLSAKIAAILLGLTLPTLYARAPYMASSTKHGRRLFFNRDLLLSVDAMSETHVPSRADILAAREERRTRGQVQRAGFHRPGCDGRHKGPCAASRRARPSERDQAHVRRSILDDLGT